MTGASDGARFVHQRPTGRGGGYRGITFNAPPGLHERCLAELSERIPPPAPVLDIAAGRGAFTRRLLDAGYRVVANDLDPAGWSVPEIALRRIDLNGPFSESFEEAFDAVAAIEVIEHLENPCHFLRECRKVLKPGGLLIVTTPNVTDFDSRWAMLRRGILNKFSPATLRDIRHMTILPWWVLETHLAEAGFSVEACVFAGEKNYVGWRRLRYHVFKMLLRPIMWDAPPGALDGDCLVSVARKGDTTWPQA